MVGGSSLLVILLYNWKIFVTQTLAAQLLASAFFLVIH